MKRWPMSTRSWRNLFWEGVETAPLIIPAALAAFSAVAVLLLLIGQFKPAYIWPLGLMAALLSAIAVWTHYPKSLARNTIRRICNILVVLGVLAWGSFNIFYTSQHLTVNRDPATYTNAGIWLTRHDNLNIPVSDVFGPERQGFYSTGVAFREHGGQTNIVHAQGLHLLPVLVGLAGRALGIAPSLHINVLFGMSALLAIYGFGRAMVRRTWWAVVATSVIAVSMPFIYFTRDMFTEPLTVTFNFGALAMIWLATKTNKLKLWLLAGLLAGAGTMARIDGFLIVAELLAFTVVLLSLSAKADRSRSAKQALAFIAGMATTGILGLLDLTQLSPAYLVELHTEFHREMLAILGILILGSVCVFLAWRTETLSRLDKATRSWRAEYAAIAALAAVVILMSRPLWFVGYDFANVRIRDYSELTTMWVAWYIGGAMAVLGVVGITLSLARSLRRKDLLLSASLLVIVGTALVYLIKPSIYPDQIWASRRLLPVILPGAAVFGAVALDWLTEEFQDRIKGGYIVAGLTSIALVLTTLTISQPVTTLRPYTELVAVNDMCAALPRNSAVLWAGIARVTMLQSTRGLCGVPSQGFGKPGFAYSVRSFQGDNSDNQRLSEAAHTASAKGYVPIIGVLASQVTALPAQDRNSLTAVSTYQYQVLENPKTRAPQIRTNVRETILMGVIKQDGQVVPLSDR